MFDDLNFSPAELDAAEKLVGYNLRIPKSAVVKGSRSSWLETVVVEEAVREDKESSSGAAHTVFSMKAKVIPGPVESDNIGRYRTEYLRINQGALKGRTDTSGKNSPQNEAQMSAMSLKKLKQIAVAAGLDLSGGLTADVLNVLFPVRDTGVSVLSGSKLAVTVTNNNAKQQPNGEDQQEFSAFFVAPTGA